MSPQRVLLIGSLVLAVGCGPSGVERREARDFAKLLRQISPEAHDLSTRETTAANELKIILEESGTLDFDGFRAKFEKSISELNLVRDRRRELLAKVSQGQWETPLVSGVQRVAIVTFQDGLVRIEGWIQMARNIRVRAELGREKEFPEVKLLLSQLATFVGEAQETPLSVQIQTLRSEYRFTESEITQ